MMEEKKRRFKILIFIVYMIGFVLVLAPMFYFLNAIVLGYVNEDLFLYMSIIVASRIAILMGMSYFLFYRKWLNQESIYLWDAFFLFGWFTFVLSFAKFVDYYIYATFASDIFSEEFFLNLTKIRYFLMLLTTMPMLYLGSEVIMIYLRTNVKPISEKKGNQYKLIIILIFLVVPSIFIILFQDVPSLTNILPFINIITMVGIVIMLIYMYKNQYLSQANGLIIGIGFLTLILSTIPRAILTSSAVVGGTTFGVLLAEIFELASIFIVFYGFITKPKYAK